MTRFLSIPKNPLDPFSHLHLKLFEARNIPQKRNFALNYDYDARLPKNFPPNNNLP